MNEHQNIHLNILPISQQQQQQETKEDDDWIEIRNGNSINEQEFVSEDDKNHHLYRNRSNLFCLNCGKRGHLTKKCNYPIISLGVITLFFENYDIDLNLVLGYSKKIQNKYLFGADEIQELKILYQKMKNLQPQKIHQHMKYLMIRRKNSLSYVDFLRGKYEPDNYEYIYNTILMMTTEEKQSLLTKSFDDLWSNLWSSPLPTSSNAHNQEYEESKLKFQRLKDGYEIQKNEILLPISIRKIIEIQIEEYLEPEWGFPKGRRNLNEKNIECAKREFQEETGIQETDYHILNLSPLEEIYLGSNHIRYKHIYYFGQVNKKIDISIDQKNINQKNEVGDIRWVTFQEGYSYIREYHKEKKNLFMNAHYFLIDVCMNFIELYQNFYKKYKSHYHL